MANPIVPIRIPLSLFQQRRFNELRAEAKAVTDRQNEAVTAIVGTSHDPLTLQGWAIQLDATEIVCTPPADGNKK